MRCSASSEYNSNYACDKIYDDGLITQSEGNEFATLYEGAGAWIEAGSMN